MAAMSMRTVKINMFGDIENQRTVVTKKNGKIQSDKVG